jgi:hypothetical protein
LLTAIPAQAQPFTSSGTRFGQNVSGPCYTDLAYTDVLLTAWWGGSAPANLPFTANNYPTQGYLNNYESSLCAQIWFCLTGDNPGSNLIYNFYGEGVFTAARIDGNFQTNNTYVPGSLSVLPPNYPGNPTSIPINVPPNSAGNPNAVPPIPANPFPIPLVIPANAPANPLNVVVTTCQFAFTIPTQTTGGYTYGYGLPLTWLSLNNINPTNLPNESPNNLHLIRPGYRAWQPNDSFFPVTDTSFPLFATEYLNSFAPFCALRMMNWMNTNSNTGLSWGSNGIVNNGTYSWANRPQFNGGQYFGCGGANNGNSGGPAYEIMIALCNATGCDMWCNVPLQATNDWKVGFANLVANDPTYHLNPWLHVYYEHCNEMWNWGFIAWQLVDQWAQADFGSDGKGAWFDHGEEMGKLLMSDVDVMQPILGSSVGRPILAGQVVDPTDYCGGGLYYIQNAYGPPKNYIYGIAGAPYFGSVDPTEITGTTQSYITANLQLAANYGGLYVCAYEAGQGLASTPESTYDTNEALQQTPAMAAQYNLFASTWYKSSCDLCNFFSNTGVDGEYGYWGALPLGSLINDLSNPVCTKFNAMAALNNSLGCNCGNAAPPPPAPTPAPATPPAPTPPAPSITRSSTSSTSSTSSSSASNPSVQGVKYLGNNRWWSPIYGNYSTDPVNGPHH